MAKRKIESIQAPRGMKDILSREHRYFGKIISLLKKYAEWYGFSFIETPVVENLKLFERTAGMATELVEKQMYILKNRSDDGKETFCLRPEGTPSVARAYLEYGMNNFPQPVKLWYWGPFFRYERPQAGRYRQFHQAGFEMIGDQSPILDAQIIQLFYNCLLDLGLKKINVQINSLGCPECRADFRRKLNGYLRNKSRYLCADCKKRVKQNPLRFLDCQQPKCQPIIEQAPQIIDSLCHECNSHFKRVLEFLDILEIPYILSHSLVRGLDYYTKTVFEIWPIKEKESGHEENAGEEELSGRQIALGGGGRYDNLMEMIGGRQTPALGGALGIERIILELKKNKIKFAQKEETPQVFLVQLGDFAKKKCLKLFQDLLKAKISVKESFCRDSIKSQLKVADRVGAKYTLILGQKEALDETVIVRDMENGSQETVPFEKTILEIKKRFKKSGKKRK